MIDTRHLLLRLSIKTFVLSCLVTCLEPISHFTIAKEHNFARAMSKRKAYDVSFKLKAMECAEKKSKEAAAREMGVDNKMIREWCKQRGVIAQAAV